MRGTLCPCPHRSRRRGIIPALAGNTADNEIPCGASWDHPRACGEHKSMGIPFGCAAGSSPRLRGTHWEGEPNNSVSGIIPALAGNTPACRSPRGDIRDHPRACGEHGLAERVRVLREGSSPRLRGTLSNCVEIGCTIGIIPALAGNTLRQFSPPPIFGDHPRACGEHRQQVSSAWNKSGSSPRLRGTRAPTHASDSARGIIPALAGNTDDR